MARPCRFVSPILPSYTDKQISISTRPFELRSSSTMSSVEEQTFPFLRLPREIRDKVYKELLCSSAPPKTTLRVGEDDLNPIQPKLLEHSVETAILLTCTQIHREA